MKPIQKILFLVPYPLGEAPSQRFRVEAFLPILPDASLEFSLHPFMDQRTWKVLYKKGIFISKATGIIKGFLKRFGILFKVSRYDYVFIHREAAPIGPPVFEWIISKILRKKIIYDFDDAIWISNTSPSNYFINWFKASWKIKYICKWSYKISVGNDYLFNYAVQFNKNVVRIPTCIDTEKFKPQERKEAEKLNIGWTGSHSTLKYLEEIVPLINDLGKEFDFDLIVIADRDPVLPVKNYKFIRWNASTEADDLLTFQIGLMPLIADAWSEGKCGFKLIQYFACGIPAVASPVGVNKTIVEDGVNGFLCNTTDQWKWSLQELLKNKSLRRQMGMAGRRKVREQFSIKSQEKEFIRLFV